MFANNDPILQIYFKDLPKGRRLSTKEELELSHRIKTGDIRALNTLVTANLLFVVKVAHNYLNQGMDLQDLISVGNIGLVTAPPTKVGGFHEPSPVSRLAAGHRSLNRLQPESEYL
jgi:DNA-directed RNA polymerase sigma subunit (sigma70/sigma32)